jgi:hypothetical protein
MDLNSLFSGLIGAVVGAVVTYLLQHRLVAKQIEAAEKTQREFLDLLERARSYFLERSKQYSSSLSNIATELKRMADSTGQPYGKEIPSRRRGTR